MTNAPPRFHKTIDAFAVDLLGEAFMDMAVAFSRADRAAALQLIGEIESRALARMKAFGDHMGNTADVAEVLAGTTRAVLHFTEEATQRIRVAQH